MARQTKAQRAAMQQSAAAPQAPWAFPKGAEIEAQHGKSAAEAFFASRALIIVPEAEPEADEPEISDDEIAAQQKAAEAAFDAAIENAMATAESAAPARGAKRPYIHSSTIAKPTKKVWAIADAMIAHAEANNMPDPTRGEIIAECIARGIASGTSATQYQHWKKANGR